MSRRTAARAILTEVWTRFQAHQGTMVAGHLAFSAMLAFLPFMIFATALSGMLVGPEAAQQAVETMFDTVPEHVAKTLDPVLHEVLGVQRPGVLTVSGLGTLWAASTGVEALRVGLDTAYGVGRERHLALNRLVALGLVLGGMAVFAVLAALLVFAPLVFSLVERWTGIPIPREADLLRYGAGLGILCIALWGAHRFLPSARMRRMPRWPGVLVSLLLWMAAAEAMSVYVAATPSYALTYGTLSGVMVTLLFFYALGAALLIGAEVNAVLHRRRNAASGADVSAPGLP